MGQIFSGNNTYQKLIGGTISADNISQINENNISLVNGVVYYFYPDIKTKCFSLLTNLKNGGTNKIIVYRDGQTIYAIVSTLNCGLMIEEYYSDTTLFSPGKGYYLKEKEM